MSALVLCRFGEIFLKGANRGRFEGTLVDAIKRAVNGLAGAVVERPHGRIIVRVDDDHLEEAATRLSRIFGIVSLSPGVSVPREMEAIGQAAVRAAQTAKARDPRLGTSFKIDARRSDKAFPLKSYDIAREIGSRVNIETGIPVDVRTPALTIGVEIGLDRAYVFSETRPGPGGLPVSISGRALLLLSGGIDSPVAAWLSAKRGLLLDGLYFHSPPFVGERSKDKVIALARALNGWQALRSLHIAHFTDVQKKLRESGRADLAVVLYRRMMMRVADRLADRLGASALVTGENLGQVASQTMPNMTVIQQAARHLVLRPLVTYDKNETIAIARKIGTFDTSSLPYEDCCSLFVPAHPATAARLIDVQRAEARLDVEAEADAIAAGLEEVRLRP